MTWLKKLILLVVLTLFAATSGYSLELISEQTSKASLADGDMFLGELADNSDFVHTTIGELKANTFQPLNSTLTTLAGITYSANMQSFFAAANYAAMQTLLNIPMQADCSGITAGICLDTDNGQLYSWDGDSVELVGVLSFQPLNSDLTSIAALTTTAYGRALLELANEAALQALITSPWADADVADDITVSNYEPLLVDADGLSTAIGDETTGTGDVVRADDPTVSDITITGGINFTSTDNGGHEFDNLPDVDQRCKGLLARVTAGEDNLAFGDWVGKAADGKFVSANATEGASQVAAFGINCNTGDTDTDEPMVVLYDGFVRDDSWDLTGQCGINDRSSLQLDDVAGQAVFGDGELLDNSAGSVPATEDDLVQYLGWCWNTGNAFGEVIRVKVNEYPTLVPAP